MGSGAQALASHVKSLKQQKETKYEDLDRWREVVGNSLDELAYWVQQCGPAGDVIAAQRFHVTTVPSNTHSNFANETKHCQYLQAQISATQQKIRLLRVSMTDLSEEHARNLAEVERRGLLGGMTLVRGLRDEIREFDYRITELQQQEADCRAKLSLVQAKLREQKAVSSATEPPDKLTSEEGEAMNGSNANFKRGTDNYDTNRPIERLPSEPAMKRFDRYPPRVKARRRRAVLMPVLLVRLLPVVQVQLLL